MGALQARLDVAEQEVGALLVGGRKLRVEVGEDVEVCDQRFAIIHVRGVLAGPEEALAGDSFQAFQIDAARKEKVGVFLREIVADDSNNRGLREKRGGKGDVGGGTAQHAIYFTVRGFNTVIRDGTYDDHGHKSPV